MIVKNHAIMVLILSILNTMNDAIVRSKFHYLFLILSILIGIIIRVYRLDVQSLWFDELYSAIAASEETLGRLYNGWILNDVHPPLYLVSLFFWVKIFGNSEFYLRLPSAIAGIASIIIFYNLSRDIFNPETRIITVILISFSSSCLYFSQEVRSYSILFMLAVICTLIWIKLLSKSEESKKNSIIYFLFSVIISYTHYFGLVLVFFQLAFLLVYFFKDKTRLKHIILISSGLVIFYGIWFIYQFFMVLKPMTGGNFWIEKPDLKFFTSYLQFIFNNSLLAFFSLLIVPLIIQPKKLIKNINIKYNIKFTALLYLCFIPLIVLFFFSFHTPILLNKYMIVFLPAVYLLIGNIIENNNLFDSNKKILYVFSVAFISFNYATTNYYNTLFKQNWRDSINFIVKTADNDSFSITLSETSEKFSKYYLDRYNKEFQKNISLKNTEVDEQLIKKIRENKIKRLFVFNSKYGQLTQNSFNRLQENSTNYENKFFHPEISVYIFYYN